MSRDAVAGNPSQRSAPGTGRWRIFLIAFGSLLIPALIWSLASPLSSVPDEPSHAIRAAAVERGQFTTPAWSENQSMGQAIVPQYVAQMHELTCYVGRPTVTPACETGADPHPDRLVTTGDTANNNGPLYYLIVGVPTLFMSGLPALYAMRFLNALLCAALFGAMIMQLSGLRRSRWAVVGAIVATTPMVLFLAGSINPNAVEMLSAGALYATLLRITRGSESPLLRWEQTIIAFASLLLLLNTRSISLLWVVLIVVAVLFSSTKASLLATFHRRSTWVLLAASVVISLLAVVFYAHPTPYAAPVSAGTGTSVAVAFVTMLARTFDFANGYIGVFGWLDTPSPTASIIVWSAVFVVLIIAALVWGSGRPRWTAAGFGLAMVLVPAVTQAFVAPQLGYIWQGRYMLAPLLCFFIACGMALDASLKEERLDLRTRGAAVVVLGLLAVTQVGSFAWTLRRYVVGSSHPLSQMVTDPSWQPPLGWIALTLLLAVWAALAVFVAYRWITVDRTVSSERTTEITEAAVPALAAFSS